MPNYIKLNSKEIEVAKFLSIDPNKVTKKDKYLIDDVIKDQENNKAKNNEEMPSTSSGRRKFTDRQKEILSLKKMARALVEGSSHFPRGCIPENQLSFTDYLEEDREEHCGFCGDCIMCNGVKEAYCDINSLYKGTGSKTTNMLKSRLKNTRMMEETEV